MGPGERNLRSRDGRASAGESDDSGEGTAFWDADRDTGDSGGEGLNRMSCVLRPTTENDLPFVVETERDAAQSRYVSEQSKEQHAIYLTDPNIRHLIIENEERAAGYLILAGLNDPNESIEFRRMVVAEKGTGLGRKALRLAKAIVFEELGAHRLWLDVKDFNIRARHLYETEGFTVEGIWREHLKTQNGRESLVFMSMLRKEFLS